MATTFTTRPGALNSISTGIANTAINSAASQVSSELDNSGASPYSHLRFQLSYSYANAPTAAKSLRIHVQSKSDGTNYPDALDVRSQKQSYSPIADSNVTHRMVEFDVPVIRGVYTATVYNVDTGQQVTCTLLCWGYNVEHYSA